MKNPPQPQDVEILDEPGVADVGPVPAGDGGASSADADESMGGKPSAAEDSGDSSPLRVKRARSSSASSRDAAGGANDLLPAVPFAVPRPPSADPKRRKFGMLMRPGAAPAGFVYLSFCDFCCLFFSFCSDDVSFCSTSPVPAVSSTSSVAADFQSSGSSAVATQPGDSGVAIDRPVPSATHAVSGAGTTPATILSGGSAIDTREASPPEAKPTVPEEHYLGRRDLFVRIRQSFLIIWRSRYGIHLSSGLHWSATALLMGVAPKAASDHL